MPFKPFVKGQNSHTHPGGLRSSKSGGSPKPTPAGPSGQFDPDDSPGHDENGDGIYGRPVKTSKSSRSADVGKAAVKGLKSFKPGQ